MKRISLIYYFLLIIIGIQAQNLSPQQDKKGRWGYADATGTIVIKCKYSEVQPFANGVAIVKQGEKYGFINEKGKPVGNGIAYSSITNYPGTNNYLVSVGGKKSDDTSKSKTRRLLNLDNFAGSCLVNVMDAKWGIVSNTGETILPIEYSEISSLKNGVAHVIKNKVWGLIGENMKLIVEPKKYTLISDFCDKGIALVQMGNKNGVIGLNGNVILEPKWDKVDIMPTEDSIYVSPSNKTYTIPGVALGYIVYANKYLKKGSYTMLCDTKGKVVVPEGKLTYMGSPSEGVVVGWVWKSKNKQSVLLDLANGQIYDLPTSDKSWYKDFKYGAALGNDGEKYFFVGRDGKKCSDYYSFMGKQKEGHRIIKKYGDTKYGVMDSLRNIVVPMIYDDTKSFVSQGLLGVSQGGKWGYVNMKGEIVTELKYDSVGMHKDSIAIIGEYVNGGKSYGLIDCQNNILVPVKWDYTIKDGWVYSFCYYKKKGQKLKNVWVQKNMKYSLYDVTTMSISHENEYDYVFNIPVGFGKEKWYVLKDLKWGVLDIDGNIMIPIVFENIKPIYSFINEKEKNKETPVMTYIDAYRLNLQSSGAANKNKLDDKIDESLWDF